MGENELDSIVVTLSEDKMNAFLCLRTPYGIDGADKKYNYEEVLERIKECGVKMGINEQKIHSMIDNKTYDSTEIIASGKASQDGEDGEYKFFFETKHNGKPVVNEDGSVDYYNIKLFDKPPNIAETTIIGDRNTNSNVEIIFFNIHIN